MAGKHIYRDDSQPTAYNRICSDSLERMLKLYVLKMSMIMLSFVAALIGPVYAYFDDGSLVTLYQIRIPFLHENPQQELMANFIWQGLISGLGGIGLIVIEGKIALIDATIAVSSKLSKLDLDELSDKLEVDEIWRQRSSGRQLTKIFMKIVHMDG